MTRPHLKIKNKFQKRKYLYSDILTKNILKNICKKATGVEDFTYEFDNSGYNKGRLVTIEYNNQIIYISLSEQEIKSRNSPLQSFPTTLNNFFLEKNMKKRICFYFLPTTGSSFETNYFMFMYRLMKTIGVEFLNEDEYLTLKIKKFEKLKDLIDNRNLNSARNRRNKSTYLTKNTDNEIEIYGKTYGANKYETTLLSLALNKITNSKIKIFQISEGNLDRLPAKSIKVINSIDKIELLNADLSLKPDDVLNDSKLRSPAYVYTLFRKLGDKKCSFCDCEESEIIQGAHIWPVSEIRKIEDLPVTKKMEYALDNENGIWLCTYHHKLFDNHMFMISTKGNLKFKSIIKEKRLKNIKNNTTIYRLPKNIVSNKFIFYLKKRNELLNEAEYL